jgi:hypothetical protein
MTSLEQIALQTVLDGLLLALAAYKAFGISYFTEKGKNLATREDVEDITRKVEGIKSEFTRDTEQLKAELQHYSQARILLSTDAKNALVNCYEKYQFWKLLATDTSTGEYFDANTYENAINQRTEKIDQAYLDLLQAEAKMKLYVDEDTEGADLMASYHQCKIGTMGCSNTLKMQMEALRYVLKIGQTRVIATEEDRRENNRIMHEEKIQILQTCQQLTLAYTRGLLAVHAFFRDQMYNHISRFSKMEDRRADMPKSL